MGAAAQIGWVEYDCRSDEEKAADGDDVYDAPTRVGALRQPDIQELFALAGMDAPDPLAPLPPPSDPAADRCTTESGVRLRSISDARTEACSRSDDDDETPKVGATGLIRLPFESLSSLSDVLITVMPQLEAAPAPEPPAAPAARFGVAEAVIAASAVVILFAAGLVAYTLF
jgi:hypothetical protein